MLAFQARFSYYLERLKAAFEKVEDLFQVLGIKTLLEIYRACQNAS